MRRALANGHCISRGVTTQENEGWLFPTVSKALVLVLLESCVGFKICFLVFVVSCNRQIHGHQPARKVFCQLVESGAAWMTVEFAREGNRKSGLADLGFCAIEFLKAQVASRW